MFYIFFGLSMGRQQSPDAVPMARYLLATYGAFGVMGATPVRLRRGRSQWSAGSAGCR